MSHINYISNKRKSIRKFADAKLEPEAIQSILEVALRAPTSCNSKGTRFILIEDPEMLEKLSKARKMGSKFLAGAALGIVVAVDLDLARRPEADCAIAASYMQLAITDLELASCWCHIADCRTPDGDESEAYVKKLLNIPPSVGVLCILGVGVPADDKELEPRNIDLDWGRVSIGEFVDHVNNYPDEEKPKASCCGKKEDEETV